VFANLTGMAIFLRWSASCCWIEPELKDVPGASGGAAFVWALGPLPILVAFMLADFGWAAVVEIRSSPGRRLKPLAIPLLVIVGWAVAFVFDGLHHGA
jgi:hypothetical protein